MMFEINGKYTSAKVMIDDVEESCIGQIYGFVNHPAFTNPIAIMPDTHAGKGSVIGFTMPMTDKVIPNVIGVDIGCGMLALNIGKELTVDLAHLDLKIRNRVPFGFNVHQQSSSTSAYLFLLIIFDNRAIDISKSFEISLYFRPAPKRNLKILLTSISVSFLGGQY